MPQENTLIITNRDRRGHPIRPRNWAARLAGNAATFHRGRLNYDERVQPCMACKGHICLRVDRSIKDDKPHVMDAVLTFMRVHGMLEYTTCPRTKQAGEQLAA